MLAGCSGSSLSSQRPGTGGTTVAGSTDLIGQGGLAPPSSFGTGGSGDSTGATGSGGSTGRDAGSGGVPVASTGSGGASVASGGSTTFVAASGGMVAGSGGVAAGGTTGGIGGATGMGAVGGAGVGGYGAGGGGSGGTGNAWTDPNCYMRCGQGNAIYYYGGAGGRGGAGGGSPTGGNPSGGATGTPGWTDHEDCSMAISLECGQQVLHSTLVEGRPNYWEMYNASARVASGPETIYVFRPTVACQATVELRPGGNDKRAANLGLFLLTGCGSRWNTDMRLLLTFSAQAGQTYYLVVDGFDGDGGGYNLRVDCGAH
jgi:hypothetical protein